MVGATGRPQRSMKKATPPAINITITPNIVLLMAKLPTMQNSRISGVLSIYRPTDAALSAHWEHRPLS